MSKDGWLDNVDKKIKLRWMLNYYLRDKIEQKLKYQQENVGEYYYKISFEFKGDFEFIKKSIEDLQKQDTVFKILKNYQKCYLTKSVYTLDGEELLYQFCKLDVEYGNLQEKEIEALLGFLYLKGYQEKILDALR